MITHSQGLVAKTDLSYTCVALNQKVCSNYNYKSRWT